MAIRVELELDTDEFERGIIRARSSLRDLEQNAGGTVKAIHQINEHSRSFITTLRDATVILGQWSAAVDTARRITTGWISEIVHLNADVERMSSLLKAMSTSANPVKEASDYIKNLREEAKQAPFALQAMHQAFIRMKAGGLDPAAGSMKALTDAVAAFGGTDETLGRASLAFQEMAGKGVVQMKELRNQLGMAVPAAMQLLARSVGVTYEQLMSDVHTGTVSAKTAIEALNREFERVYGGAAVRQMETFNGQLARMKVILMDLAIKAGGADEEGDKGFFGQLKKQFKEFNDALTGSFGQSLAAKVGEALTGVMLSIRKGIDTVVEFRSAILSVGEAMAYGFGARMVISGLASVVSMIGNVRTSIAALGIEWSLAWRNIATETAALNIQLAAIWRNVQTNNASLAAGLAAMGAGFTNVGTAIASVVTSLAGFVSGGVAGVASLVSRITILNGTFTALSGAFRILGAALPAVFATLTTLAPELALIAGALVLAAHAFGLFKDEAKDAWEEMNNFGAHSLTQVDAGEKYVDRLQKNYERLAKARRQFGRLGATDKQVDDAGNELHSAQEKLATFRSSAIHEEGRRKSEDLIGPVRDEIAAQRRKYAAIAELADKAYKEEVHQVTLAGRSTALVREKFQTESKERFKQSYDDQIAILERFQEKYQQQIEKGNAVERAAAEQAIDKLRKMIEEQKSLRQQEIEAGMGTPKEQKALDDDRLFKKGERFLEKLNADVEGAKAGLHGLDQELYALKQSLADMKFGDPGIERVQELINKITAAKEEADDLNKILTGKQHLDHELLNEEIKLRQRIIDLQTEGMSDADKLRVKIQSGYFNGFGEANSPMQQRLIDLREKMQGVGTEATQTGNILKNSTFGLDSTNAATGYLDIVTKIAGTFASLRSNASDLKLGDAFSAIVKTGSVPVFSTEPTSLNDGSYIQNLIRRESGGRADAAAKTSSAVGLTQFVEDTWIQFIKEIHPELISFGEKAALDLRKNENLSKEAGAWYAEKNASYLTRKGIDPTDANVYAAHFLGPKAAANVLSSDDRLALAAIPGMSKILISNPSLRSQTVGDFKARNEKDFGSGYTWSQFTGGPGVAPKYKDDSKLGRPSNVPDDVNSRLQKLDADTQTVNELETKKNIRLKAEELSNLIEQAAEIEEGNNKRLAALKKLIKEGKIDSSNKDPESERYKELIKLATQLDAAEEKRDKAKKARTSAAGARESLTAMMNEQLENAELRRANLFSDPNNFKFTEAYIRNEKSLNDKVDRIKTNFGDNSPEYKQALDDAQIQRERFSNAEVDKNLDAYNKKTQELRRSLMTESEAREDEFQKEIRRIDSLLERFVGSEDEKARRVQIKEDYIAAYRAKKALESPLNRQLKEWSDINGNFERSFVSAMGNVTDAAAGALVGIKTNWGSLLQSISKDMMNLVLRWSLSTVGKMAKGGGTNKLGGLGGGMLKMSPVAHTGGISGGSMGFRSAPISLFAGAERFHIGGVIGSAIGALSEMTAGGALAHDEVPIITRKGEGVFTEEQMASIVAIDGKGAFSREQIAAMGNPRIMDSVPRELVKSNKNPKFHTGGIIGFGAANGINIPKFHEGGIVNTSGFLNMRPKMSDIPGFAKSNSDSNIGNISASAANSIKIDMPITVNAAGGTPEQNADLAKKVGSQIEEIARSTVVDEIRRQFRPGNMLSSVSKSR
jgi:tape measure domain-containing protein